MSDYKKQLEKKIAEQEKFFLACVQDLHQARERVLRRLEIAESIATTLSDITRCSVGQGRAI